LPGAGDRADRACSTTRPPRTPAGRPGLRGSAARCLPRTPSAAASGPPCTSPATGITRPRTKFPGSSGAGCRATRKPQTSCAPTPPRPPPEGPVTFRPCSDTRSMAASCLRNGQPGAALINVKPQPPATARRASPATISAGIHDVPLPMRIVLSHRWPRPCRPRA
jgi:hypothetical protein